MHLIDSLNWNEPDSVRGLPVYVDLSQHEPWVLLIQPLTLKDQAVIPDVVNRSTRHQRQRN